MHLILATREKRLQRPRFPHGLTEELNHGLQKPLSRPRRRLLRGGRGSSRVEGFRAGVESYRGPEEGPAGGRPRGESAYLVLKEH